MTSSERDDCCIVEKGDASHAADGRLAQQLAHTAQSVLFAASATAEDVRLHSQHSLCGIEILLELLAALGTVGSGVPGCAV